MFLFLKHFKTLSFLIVLLFYRFPISANCVSNTAKKKTVAYSYYNSITTTPHFKGGQHLSPPPASAVWFRHTLLSPLALTLTLCVSYSHAWIAARLMYAFFLLLLFLLLLVCKRANTCVYMHMCTYIILLLLHYIYVTLLVTLTTNTLTPETTPPYACCLLVCLPLTLPLSVCLCICLTHSTPFRAVNAARLLAPSPFACSCHFLFLVFAFTCFSRLLLRCGRTLVVGFLYTTARKW